MNGHKISDGTIVLAKKHSQQMDKHGKALEQLEVSLETQYL